MDVKSRFETADKSYEMRDVSSRTSIEKKAATGMLVAIFAVAFAASLYVGSALGASVGSTGAGHGAATGTGLVASMPKPERWIRERIMTLTQLDSPDVNAAADDLKTAPRAVLLAVLRDDLRADPLWVPRATLKAMILLHAVELAPELKELAGKSEDWALFAHINSLIVDEPALQTEFAQIYLRRMPSILSSAAKVAVLEGLSTFKVAVDDEAFGELLLATNYDVRISAIRNLFETHATLKKAERVRRLVLSLDARPKQARVLAMKTVIRLPAEERRELSGLLSHERCEREADKQVRVACETASKSLGRGSEK